MKFMFFLNNGNTVECEKNVRIFSTILPELINKTFYNGIPAVLVTKSHESESLLDDSTSTIMIICSELKNCPPNRFYNSNRNIPHNGSRNSIQYPYLNAWPLSGNLSYIRRDIAPSYAWWLGNMEVGKIVRRTKRILPKINLTMHTEYSEATLNSLIEHIDILSRNCCEICNRINGLELKNGLHVVVRAWHINGNASLRCLTHTPTICEICHNPISDMVNLHRVQNTHYGEVFTVVCNDCYIARYVCANCGNTIEQHSLGHPYNGRYLCHDCFVSMQNTISPTRRWGSVELRTGTCDTNSPTYGAEIEFEVDGDRSIIQREVFKIDKSFGIGYDGSLDSGLEIQTPPMTLEYVKKQSKLNEILDIIKANGGNIKSTCGGHIHVGKSFLSHVQWTNVAAFWNNPVNRPFFEAICGRSNKGYYQYHDPYDILKNGVTQSNWRGKGEATNFSYKKTVEFRQFCGTICYGELVGRMEFLEMLLNFWKSRDIRVSDIFGSVYLLSDFVEYILLNKSENIAHVMPKEICRYIPDHRNMIKIGENNVYNNI